MRITIEVDERAGTTVQTAPESPVAAEDAGTPPQELLQLLQPSTPALTAAAAVIETLDAGAPPEWLEAAIKASISASTSGETTTPAVGDAGAAPIITAER